MDIIEKGGSAAVSMLAKIIGKNVPRKDVRTVEKGGKGALSVLDRLIGKNVPDKSFTIRAVDAATQSINSIIGVLNAIQAVKTVQVITEYSSKGKKGRASGQRAGNAPINAMIGEGKGPEWRYNARTGAAEKVMGPMFTRLSQDEAIIPTEQRYRHRAKSILGSLKGSNDSVLDAIAKDAGVERYEKGKKKKSIKSCGSIQGPWACPPTNPEAWMEV